MFKPYSLIKTGVGISIFVFMMSLLPGMINAETLNVQFDTVDAYPNQAGAVVTQIDGSVVGHLNLDESGQPTEIDIRGNIQDTMNYEGTTTDSTISIRIRTIPGGQPFRVRKYGGQIFSISGQVNIIAEQVIEGIPQSVFEHGNLILYPQQGMGFIIYTNPEHAPRSYRVTYVFRM